MRSMVSVYREDTDDKTNGASACLWLVMALLLAAFQFTGGAGFETIFSREGTLWWVAATCAMAIVFTLLPVARWLSWWTRRPWRGWLLATIFALIAFLATAHLAYGPYGHLPRVQDEVNYFFMGKMFASGHVWLDVPAAREFFAYRFFVQEEHFYSLFQPGWPLVLAMGHLLGAPWLMGPLCVGLATVLVFGVARQLMRDGEALCVVALIGVSHVWWFQGASMMSHMYACLLGLVAVHGALQGYGTKKREDDNRRMRMVWLIISGGAFGLMFSVRAATAVALCFPVMIVGGYGLLRDRTRWREALCFLIALSAMGSLQLGYNAWVTGSLSFAQDRYFDLTEPVRRCHRLGLGAGIGCPHEHGPDLGRYGFTASRAWEVTRMRLEQLRWDLFGAGVGALWSVFALGCWRRRKTVAFLASLCLSVISLYFFYYYHGNLYGARYYFEIIPYLMMLCVLGVSALFARVDALCHRSPGLRRLGHGVLLGVVALLPMAHLTRALPAESERYEGYWRFAKELRDAELAATQEDAIILVPNDFRSYWAGFALNDGDLAGDRIYLRDWGREMNARLVDLYPGREIFRAARAADGVRFEPVSLPDSSRVVFEGEALFPPSRRVAGYAEPQSLKPWRETALASRQEHLFFSKTAPGSWFEFDVFIAKAGSHEVSARLTKGPDYGKVELSVQGEQLTPAFDGHSSQVEVSRWRASEPVVLKRGWNTVRIAITGKHEDSTGWVAGLDQLVFTPITSR